MTAVLEPPKPVARVRLSPAGGTPVDVTQAELDAAEKWLEENLKPSPIIPRIKPSNAVYMLKTGQEQQLTQIIEQTNSAIVRMESDPLRQGYEPDCWADADALMQQALLTCIFGGNGSSKTYYSARTGMRKLVTKPGAKVLFLHEAQQPSIDIQQAAVYHYLPREWKNIKYRKSDRITKINYTRAGGFVAGSHHKFVCPNGSMAIFGFYNQDIKVAEGYGWDLVCADEDLPLGWLKTLLYRLPRCGGKMIWAFTPIRGITPAIKEVVDGAKITKTLKAELLDQHRIHVTGCPKGHMPYMQDGIFCDSRIIYFFTEMNPWSGYDQQKKVSAQASQEEKERRNYGWSRQSIGKKFPKFGAHNIVTEIPKQVTRYVMKDPGGGRNAYFLWLAIDQKNRFYIYREWPNQDEFGEWAVTSEDSKRFDGDRGPAQRTIGNGILDYKVMMLKSEGNTWSGNTWEMKGEEIFLRLGDPRAMNDPTKIREHGVQWDDRGTSMFDLYRDIQKDNQGNDYGPSMDFIPAPGYNIDRGVEMISNLLTYDPQQPIVQLINEPRLYVHASCKNLIWSLQNWTGADGDKGASKDPIDALRYLVTADLCYHDPKMKVSYGGGSY